MIITIYFVKFFVTHVLRQLDNDTKYFFKKGYYWQIFWDEVCLINNPLELCVGSPLEDFLSLKERFLEKNCICFGLDFDRMGAILLAIATGEIEKKESSLKDTPNTKEPFIFSKEELISITEYILDQAESFYSMDIEIIQWNCWILPKNSIFDLDTEPTVERVDFHEKIILLNEIFEGKKSLNNFEIEDFFWTLKVYCANWPLSKN